MSNSTPAPTTAFEPLEFWRLAAPAERVALIDEQGRPHPYAELARAADDAAASLVPGAVFALTCSNTLAVVQVLLGALRRGAVPLLLDAGLANEQRQGLLNRYGITRHFDGRCGAWQAESGDGAGPAAHPALGLLMSTSGSTASPKLVRLSRDNLAANAGSIVQFLGIGADEVAITTLPLHYSYGLSVLNSHLAAGACVVLTETSVTQAPFWALMREHRVTSLAAVPTLWRMLRRLRFERMALPALRCVTQAGGRLEPDEQIWLADSARARGQRAFVMYGQTEATARIAYLPPDWLPAKAGAIGIPIPGGCLRVLGADGAPVAGPGIEGELAYRGPNVMMGYAETAAELAAPPDVDELRTGDLGRMDADGCFWVTGRLKRFVKLFGHRVSLDDVERALRDEGWDAAVVGRDDRLMVAVVGIERDAADQLAITLARRYHWLPAAVLVLPVQQLPLGSNGKLQYGELLVQLEQSLARRAAEALHG